MTAVATRFKGFVGSTYNLKNWTYDCQRTINRYTEFDETGQAKDTEPAQLVPTPGLTSLIIGLQHGSRNGFVTSTNVMYWTFNETLYQIHGVDGSSSGWTATSIGTIDGVGDCLYADNGITLFIVTSTGFIWLVDLASNVLTQAAGGGWVPATSLTYMDGYIVFTEVGSNQFFWTDLYATTVSGLNFAAAETNPDHAVCALSNNEDLWIFGQNVTELWYDLGSGNTVFTRRAGILVETGAASPLTVGKLNNTILWLATDQRGGPVVYMANGYSPVRVSTFAIEQMMQVANAAQISQATADCYQWNGHYFYSLNIPGVKSTLVFDMTGYLQSGKPQWHERQSGYGTAANRSIAQGQQYFLGKHVTGDLTLGNLYFYDQDNATENGTIIARKRITPHVSNGLRRMKYISLQIDYTPGTISPQTMAVVSGGPISGDLGTFAGMPAADAAVAADEAAIIALWPGAVITGDTIAYGPGNVYSRTYTITGA